MKRGVLVSERDRGGPPRTGRAGYTYPFLLFVVSEGRHGQRRRRLRVRVRLCEPVIQETLEEIRARRRRSLHGHCKNKLCESEPRGPGRRRARISRGGRTGGGTARVRGECVRRGSARRGGARLRADVPAAAAASAAGSCRSSCCRGRKRCTGSGPCRRVATAACEWRRS